MEKKSDAARSVLKTGAVLLIISAVISFLLAFVNGVTEPVIEKNEQAEKTAAIAEIFPSADKTTLSDYQSGGVTELYVVSEGETLLGYCCTVAESGFSDQITLMIGITPQLSVASVKILSVSDTPGIGLKVQDGAYLAQYEGKTNTDADDLIITGATYSSKAVRAGAADALKACAAYAQLSGGAEHE